MSYSIDANLLVYASDVHSKALAFLEGIPSRGGICYLCWPTIMAYLRISTHPRIFAAPLSPRDAETNIARLLAHPKVRVLEEGDSFWSHYAAISESMPLRGNLVPDAHIAAILNRNGITALYSRDRDFRRFDVLKVTDPLL